MSEQTELQIDDESQLDSVESYKFEPIKGYPRLNWKGKRPFTSTQYFPAQLKENHGEPVDEWMNRIYWGDNLQVMSHLLKEFRGQINQIYFDPPFDSNADYRKEIRIRGKRPSNDPSAFEEKQYTDIWANDEYLQFLYERLTVAKELLSDSGTLWLHCDWHKNYLIRSLLDEIFGASGFVTEIVWQRTFSRAASKTANNIHDTILVYGRSKKALWNQILLPPSQDYLQKRFTMEDENGRRFQGVVLTAPGVRKGVTGEPWRGYNPTAQGRHWSSIPETLDQLDEAGKLYWPKNGGWPRLKSYADEIEGVALQSLWTDISPVNSQAKEDTGFPTQKPEALLDRIVRIGSNPDDLVCDLFMGSGTLQVVAMKLGRRFIGGDINLGSVQITTKRLLAILENQVSNSEENDFRVAPGFSVYNVNQYDVFRNPVQARALLAEALEVQPLPNNALYDGEKDGRMVKIMPVDRIATKADLNPLITGFDYKAFQKKQEGAPSKPVESLLLICMGHEPDLAAHLMKECPFDLDVNVVDILRDKGNLEFKRDSEAEILVEDGQLRIVAFYPMNLLQKLSLQKAKVEEWRELTESVMIDWNYDGGVFEPSEVDIPEKNEWVNGGYVVPKDAGTIRVKITDLLSESLEMEVHHG